MHKIRGNEELDMLRPQANVGGKSGLRFLILQFVSSEERPITALKGKKSNLQLLAWWPHQLGESLS